MQLEFLRFIQSFSHPVLDFVFNSFSLLGEPVMMVTFFALIYWCIDKQMGRYMLFSLCASLCLNGIVKDIVKAPRPVGQPGIATQRMDTATGHSFPSAHTQSSTAMWGAGALWLKKRWIIMVACVIVGGVGLSRLYLGVHYPADVLGGLLIGLACAYGIYGITQKNDGVGPIALLAVLFASGVLLVGQSKDTFTALALFLGFGLGDWFEKHLVRFSVPNRLGKSALRFLLGMGTLGLIYYPLHQLGKLHPALDFSAYVILGFSAVGLCPWLMKITKL